MLARVPLPELLHQMVAHADARAGVVKAHTACHADAAAQDLFLCRCGAILQHQHLPGITHIAHALEHPAHGGVIRSAKVNAKADVPPAAGGVNFRRGHAGGIRAGGSGYQLIAQQLAGIVQELTVQLLRLGYGIVHQVCQLLVVRGQPFGNGAFQRDKVAAPCAFCLAHHNLVESHATHAAPVRGAGNHHGLFTAAHAVGDGGQDGFPRLLRLLKECELVKPYITAETTHGAGLAGHRNAAAAVLHFDALGEEVGLDVAQVFHLISPRHRECPQPVFYFVQGFITLAPRWCGNHHGEPGNRYHTPGHTAGHGKALAGLSRKAGRHKAAFIEHKALLVRQQQVKRVRGFRAGFLFHRCKCSGHSLHRGGGLRLRFPRAAFALPSGHIGGGCGFFLHVIAFLLTTYETGLHSLNSARKFL